MTQVVIAENGYPVRFVVPDPRVFALHQIWLSTHPTRESMKRKRDFRQGEAVASLTLDYLNLSFDDEAINLPIELASMQTRLIDRPRSRQSGKTETAHPLRFSDCRSE